jgi:hypothetical protein
LVLYHQKQLTHHSLGCLFLHRHFAFRG